MGVKSCYTCGTRKKAIDFDTETQKYIPSYCEVIGKEMTRQAMKDTPVCDKWTPKKKKGAVVETTVTNINGQEVKKNVVRFGDEVVEVHDTATMTEDEKARVPERRTYIDNEDLLEAVAWAYNNDVPLSMEGHTGTGKTEALMYFAHLINAPVYKVSLNGMTTTDDLIGKLTAENGSTVWIDGIVTHVVRHGGILVLDELNAAGQEVLFTLHPLLDDTHSLTLVEHDNQVVPKHKNCQVFATMNPANSPLYPDTQVLSEALRSRFGIWMQVNWMSAVNELKVLKAMNLGLDADTLKVMLKVAGYARKALEQEKLYFAFSTRTIKKWAQLATRFGVRKGADMAFLNGLDADNRIIMEEIIDTQLQ